MKGIIDLTNYEDYFLLYVDGELNAQEQEAVRMFIEEHPELKGELELLLSVKQLPDEAVVFSGKEQLLLDTAEVKDEDIINFLDKEELGEAVKKKLADPDPALKKRIQQFENTKLVTDTAVRFPDKQRLYKGTSKTVRMGWWYAAAAAAVIIAFGINFFRSGNDATNRNPAVADLEDTSAKYPVATVVPDAPAADHSPVDTVDTRKKIAQPGIVESAITKKPGAAVAVAGKPEDSRQNDLHKKTQEVERAFAPDTKGMAANNPVKPVPPAVTQPDPINSTANELLNKPPDSGQLAVANDAEPATDNKPEKAKRSLFKKIGNSIKDRALDVLTNGDEDGVTIAGFAVNISR